MTDGATDALQSLHFQWSTRTYPNPVLSPFPGGESYTPGLNVSVLFPILTPSFSPKVPVQIQVIRYIHSSSFRQNDCWEPLKSGQLRMPHPRWVWVLSCQGNALGHSAVPSVSHTLKGGWLLQGAEFLPSQSTLGSLGISLPLFPALQIPKGRTGFVKIEKKNMKRWFSDSAP